MRLTKILAGVLLVLALGLALLAWVLSRETPRAAPVAAVEAPAVVPEPRPAVSVARYPVLVVNQMIPAGQRITDDDIKIIEKTEHQPGTFSQTADVLGKTTLIALGPEEVVLEQHLVNGLSLQLENGQRAVSIAVKEPMAAGNYIRPGDFVDVFFTLQGDGAEPKVDTQTRLLMARARVLAYGSHTVENPPPSIAQRNAEQSKEGNQRAEARGRAEIPNTAVLAVPLEDVQRLTLAEKYGQLSLALRHPSDLVMPDAELFAALPLALRPRVGRIPSDDDLNAINQAYAGLRWSDLADGGGQARGHVAVRSAPSMKTGRQASSASEQTMEVLQGNTAKTVRY